MKSKLLQLKCSKDSKILYRKGLLKMKLASDSSIAIIGGADGPTAVMVSGDPTATVIAIAVAVIAVIAIVAIVIRKRKKK